MWILIRKELLTNLLTLRLGVALVFTVVLAVLATLIGSVDYSQSVASYEKELANIRQSLDEATVYRNVRPHVLVPPLPLSILSRGVVQTSAQRVGIQTDAVPIAALRQGIFDNHLMNVLIQIDFSTVVAILLSFLAVVLGFDGICGERESGTLGQLLTNPVPRGSVALSKLIGGAISLWVPFALALAISLLIMLANPDLHLSSDDWVRVAIFFCLSCLFLAQVYSFSLMVSALTRESSTSLIICLFSWLVAGIGYTSLLPSAARFGVDEPAADVYRDQNGELWGQLGEQMDEWEARNPSPGPAFMKEINRDGVIRYGHAAGYRWRERRLAFEMEKRLDRADRQRELQWANWGPLATEAYLVDDWSILSPFTNYQVLSYYLANTSLNDTFFLAALGRDYRDTFISYLRSKRAFSSRRWFTDDPGDQEPMIPDPEAVTDQMLATGSPFMEARMAWADRQDKLAADDDRRQLDLTDLPKFGGRWKRSLAESLEVMTPGLAVLVLALGVTVLVTMLAFLRYDPR